MDKHKLLIILALYNLPPSTTIYIYIYIAICAYIHTCIHIHIYIYMYARYEAATDVASTVLYTCGKTNTMNLTRSRAPRVAGVAMDTFTNKKDGQLFHKLYIGVLLRLPVPQNASNGVIWLVGSAVRSDVNPLLQVHQHVGLQRLGGLYDVPLFCKNCLVRHVSPGPQGPCRKLQDNSRCSIGSRTVQPLQGTPCRGENTGARIH